MQEERRFNIRTLVIASAASAAAALITSQFWIRGTPIAAALTPVIVALVSELLHRPTERIAQRMTSETDALPEAAGAGPPPPSEETAPQPAIDPGQVRVYKPAKRRRIAWAAVLTTAALAFGIAAVALTVPELIAGGSIGKGDGTTIFGGKRGKSQQSSPPPAEEERTVTETVPTETETVTVPAPEPEERQQTTPTTPEPESTTPVPTTTTPAPAPRTAEPPPAATTP